MRRGLLTTSAAGLLLIGIATASSGWVAGAQTQGPAAHAGQARRNPPIGVVPATPIQHLVVIYGENISFDHYFGTYPSASNVAGEPAFTALPGTPTANNYETNPTLLTNNPNFTNAGNGAGAANPFRLDRTQAATADQGHSYTPEQEAFDKLALDLFPEFTGNGTAGGVGAFGTKGQVMGYFDGNTVTAMWNYAQNFAMSDNSYGDQFGPSTPGALNVISGQTNGMVKTHGTSTSFYVNDTQGGFTMINDVDPANDTCSIAANSNEAYMTGQNIGDLLNAQSITWGSFMGGFNLNLTNSNGTSGCGRSTFSSVVGATTADYVQHHAWFQYYASTANPTHARPQSVATIGSSFETDGVTPEPANHNYDLQDFYAAVRAGNFPAVSFIKMSAYQDAHAGYSDPLDEQAGVVALINFLQQQPAWSSTAVIIAYDDSDGWYDHAFATTTSPSYDATADQLNASGTCGTGTQQNGLGGQPVNGRCGPGPRLPFMVISPWAKPNYISHTQISQVSVTRFIEDNWLSQTRLGGGSFDANAGSIMDMFDFGGSGTNPARFLNPTTGNRSVALTHDFKDNGMSDILWRDTSGDLAMWLMSGGQLSSGAGVAQVPTNWSVAGTRDFNGDGEADILWLDSAGDVAIWLMNGSSASSFASLGNVGTQWAVAGTGDFNGDGTGDILWRNSSTGDVAIWLMSNGALASGIDLGTVPTTWHVAGTGDFNGDGTTDILWRNTSTGQLAIWFISNGQFSSGVNVGTVSTAWTVVNTGDFNGDGVSDIAWRDSAGDLAIWLMNSDGQMTSGTTFAGVPTTWSVAETGDFNGDGNSDILWIDQSGDLGLWSMNGLSISSQSGLGNVGTTWTVQGQNAD